MQVISLLQPRCPQMGNGARNINWQMQLQIIIDLPFQQQGKWTNITYKVTDIEPSAFKGNTRLKKVTIGSNVTSIGANAFFNCISLKSITIPANIKSIGKKTFYGCRNLKKVTIKTTKLTVSKVGANAFKGIHKKAVMRVPKRKFSAYKNILKKKGAGAGVVYKKMS